MSRFRLAVARKQDVNESRSVRREPQTQFSMFGSGGLVSGRVG